jgi:hypothetical protein
MNMYIIQSQGVFTELFSPYQASPPLGYPSTEFPGNYSAGYGALIENLS